MVRNLGRVAIIDLGLYAARRYFRNWGTTKEECRVRLPGDELVGKPAVQTTEAVMDRRAPQRGLAMSGVDGPGSRRTVQL
jgi:hypothetical protein